MQTLLKGIVEFKEKDFEKYKELFTSICKHQDPHTLFIGCSDSRVIPNMITKTLPGELFVLRNIANLVPPYREVDEYLATTSGIEYAVKQLNVENIIVCGHSNCGGCASLFIENTGSDELPATSKWMNLAKNVLKQVNEQLPDGSLEAKGWLAEQINVVEQMKHLLTYPYIKEKYEKKEINIFGWHYIIETGDVFNYDSKKGVFELIN
ncbi:MAG: carbonic anhydrase [Candidatus Margulisbacteria bacterium]|nr:carbonic anhydrase [Candidatus Margulisiibacteriota bacterium]